MKTQLPKQTDRKGLLELAQRCGEFLSRQNPYIRMLAVSGSLSRPEHEEPHEDIDFFVVTAKGRLWEAFMGCVLNGWRFARHAGVDRKFFCFNYLVAEDHPQEIDLSRPEYAREFLHLEVLFGLETYAALLDRFRSRLSVAAPALYEEVRSRVRATLETSPASAAASGRSGKAGRWGRAGFYRTLRLPFIAVAKEMERRRRGRFPGGLVYSNARVIRSHFRRSWGDDPLTPDDLPSSEAFSHVAASYDETVTASPANRHMRAIVHDTMAGMVGEGSRVLDLGAGTGVDAVWLARRGASILAIDVAEGMVGEAIRRVEDSGVGHRVEVRQLPIEELRALLPEHARSFDVVLADFGALNLCGNPARWAPVVARLLKPGGVLVASVMGRWSPWEILAGLARGRPSFALRRLRGDPVSVGGVPLAVALYTPGGFAVRLSPHFQTVSARALCAFLPPPDLEHVGSRVPGLHRALAWLDTALGRLPVVRSMGDHFLIVMRQTEQPLLRRRTRGSVTAAPVVADVNGDGVPETIVASDKLYVLDGQGRDLRGWPVRAGAPLASTPAVVPMGDGQAIYAGSDDDHLHGRSFEGERLNGFPLRTGGDVFSSPLALDLDGDGRPELVFGSDDGNIYAVDLKGHAKPGWPVRTEGYVSASPVPFMSSHGLAVVIGSWDGRLYAVDSSGQDLPGWPRYLDFPIWGTAAVADIDGDGLAEIVVASTSLFAYRGDGSLVPGFPVRLSGYAVASPAVGDIDGDGSPEVVVCADRLYAFRGNGEAVAGFPMVLSGYIWASPILVDVDGDGVPEIVVGDFRGDLWAVTGSGAVVNGYPRRMGRSIAAPATAADVSGDGYLELVVATWDGEVIAMPTECRNDPVTAPWPAFRGRPGAPPPRVGKTGLAGRRPDSRTFGPTVRAGEARGPDGAAEPEIRLSPRTPRPRRVITVHLDLAADRVLRGGLLRYTLRGKVHPSPVLGGPGSYFALVQPAGPLRRVDFDFLLQWEDGSVTRLPRTGAFTFRVGVPGLRLSRETP